MKEIQLELHDAFINLVKSSRGNRLADNDDLFTGMFWAGQKGRELGLVDAIGDVRSSIKSRYGEKTELKLIEAKRGLFGRKSALGMSNSLDTLGQSVAGHAADGLISALDERALWSRFGL